MDLEDVVPLGGDFEHRLNLEGYQEAGPVQDLSLLPDCRENFERREPVVAKECGASGVFAGHTSGAGRVSANGL